MIALGIIMVAVGMAIILAGVVGGVMKMLNEVQSTPRVQGAGGAVQPVKFVEAMTEFFKALAVAPTWLAVTGVGFLLIVVGLIVLAAK